MTKKQVKKGGETEKEPAKPATEPVETKDSETTATASASAPASGFWSKLFGTSTEANEVVKEKEKEPEAKAPTPENGESKGVLDTVKGWFQPSNDDIKLTGGMRKKSKKTKTKTKLRKRALKSKRSRI